MLIRKHISRGADQMRLNYVDVYNIVLSENGRFP
jgi:hypothetical protein